jgi:membrane protease subunit (stomatin/prohibitin family)
MPLFEGHDDSGLQRLFIEMPDGAKGAVAWKWPDQQIIQHSILNVDLDYQAVFTNLGKVIGVLGPGRHQLDQGASLALGWLVDHLTGDAYYDAEVYFVTTREITGLEFGGPVDNLTDAPTGLVVSVRVFGELAYRVTDPAALLAHLIGTGESGNFDHEIASWATEQALAAIRAVLPDIVAPHGVLAMGQLQDATASAALAKANEALSAYGLALSRFAELNVNLPDADAAQLKQLAATKAYTNMAGSFEGAVRGQAALEIAGGIAHGQTPAQEGLVSAMMMGVPLAPGATVPATAGGGVAVAAATAQGAPSPVAAAPAAGAPPVAAAAAGAAPGATAPPSAIHFCPHCGNSVDAGDEFCPNCGKALHMPEST